jgi:hypothetical protein
MVIAAPELIDLPCIDCEYSLRGLPREGRCPECGSEIEHSWRRQEALLADGRPPLWMSSPAWLRRMGAGCALVLGSALGLMTLSFLGTRNPQPAGPSAYVAMSLWMTTSAGLVIGLWLLGSRELATSAGFPDGRLIRAGAILEVLRVVRTFVWNPRTFDGHWYIAIGTTALAAIVTALAWQRLGRLARRTSWAKVSRSARWMGWLMPVIMIVQVVFFRLLPMSRVGAVLIAPHTVLGETSALVILPVGLIKGGAAGLTLLFWVPALITTLAALATLAGMMWIFFHELALSSACRQRAAEERQPVPAHDAGDVGVGESGR